MPLVKTVWRLLLPYKGGNLKTITTDNGSELAAHEWITDKLGVSVFFTDAYCSWQKGAVENTNKLVRQYIPKGMDISRGIDKKLLLFKRNKQKTKGKTQFRYTDKLFLQHFSLILHLLLDSTKCS